jgi:hypothetical protein
MHLLPFRGRAIILTALSFGLILSCKKDNNPTPPPVSDVHLKNGLLVYLPFQGNMADSSGNGNSTAPLPGTTLTYDEHGTPNNAFGGTGNGEGIQVINNGSIKFDTAFSVSFDFMIRSFGTNTLFSMSDYNTGKGVSFDISTGIPGYQNLVFGVANAQNGCDQYPSNVTNMTTDTTGFIPQPESWYNLIAIFQSGTLKVYINGKLISTKTSNSHTVMICPTASLMVSGWWAGGQYASLNGKMDEVRLYNRVLNADEISTLAKNSNDY